MSGAKIGIGDCTSADHLRDRDNTVWIGDTSAEIRDDGTGIVNITTKVIPC